MAFANNLTAVCSAIDQVRWICRYGASNKATDRERTSINLLTREDIKPVPTTIEGVGVMEVHSLTQHLKLSAEEEFYANHGEDLARDVQIPIDAAIAAKFRVGNCEEQASVAFEFLRKQGMTPIDFMTFTGGDHAFILVGRTGDAANWKAWGGDAVVCDPWVNEHPNPNSTDASWEDYPYRPAKWAEAIQQLESDSKVQLGGMVTKSEHRHA